MFYGQATLRSMLTAVGSGGGYGSSQPSLSQPEFGLTEFLSSEYFNDMAVRLLRFIDTLLEKDLQAR